MDHYDKSEKASIKRCVPCSECNVKPEWGAAFLFCPKCEKESVYNDPDGRAVRDWNKRNKK